MWFPVFYVAAAKSGTKIQNIVSYGYTVQSGQGGVLITTTTASSCGFLFCAKIDSLSSFEFDSWLQDEK